MDKLYKEAETGCCPRFNPEPWDEKEVTFQDKLFIKDHVISFFHIPLNFGKVMTRNLEKITVVGRGLPRRILFTEIAYILTSYVFKIVDFAVKTFFHKQTIS